MSIGFPLPVGFRLHSRLPVFLCLLLLPAPSAERSSNGFIAGEHAHYRLYGCLFFRGQALVLFNKPPLISCQVGQHYRFTRQHRSFTGSEPFGVDPQLTGKLGRVAGAATPAGTNVLNRLGFYPHPSGQLRLAYAVQFHCMI